MWIRLPNLSFNIVNHQTVIIDNVVYVIGGYKNSVILDLDKISVFIISLSNYTAQSAKCNTVTWNCKTNNLDLTISSMEPVDCYGHTVVKWKNFGVLFGGCLVNQSVSYSPTKIYLFVPDSQRLPHRLRCHRNSTRKRYWIAVDGVEGSIPAQRDGHSAVVLADKMFIFGGLVGSETKHFDNKLYQLDFTCYQWTIIYNGDFIEPLARDFSSLVVYGNGLYMFGGRSDDKIKEVSNNDVYDTAVWRFDLNINRWQKIHPGYGIIYKSSLVSNCVINEQNQNYNKAYLKIPFPRRSHMSVVFQNQWIVFGGLYETSSFSIHFSDLWSFDMLSNQWTVLFDLESSQYTADKPQNLRRGSLTLINENFALLIGGVTDNCSNKFEGAVVGNCLMICNEEPLHKYYHCLNSLCDSISFEKVPLTLYQRPHDSFSGVISMINDLCKYIFIAPLINDDSALRSINHMFMLQPQLTLYQCTLQVVVKYYSLNQLYLHLLPQKIM